jgi:creatinine amidohydrolase
MRTVRFELLRPQEIVAERGRCPVAYVPVGPLEWHSLHMPVGTDALNAGAVAQRLAERAGGVVLPTLFWGTERERSSDDAGNLGFEREDYVVGMDFPNHALKSLYCPEEILALLVRERLHELIALGYELIVIVNGHGAVNHMAVLQRLCVEFTACSPARVLYTVVCPTGSDIVSGFGHADVAETSAMMALYPASVDLGALPPLPQPLRIPEWGIVDEGTFRGCPTPDHTLPREADPRLHAAAELGRRILEQTVDELEALVRAALEELGSVGDG